MRQLPAGYRTASPDGKIITVYFGEEKLGQITAKSTERADLLAAEAQALQACEKHAQAVAEGKLKPAAAQKVEDRATAARKAQVRDLVAETEALRAQLASEQGANKAAAEQVATLTARVAELEKAATEKKPAK